MIEELEADAAIRRRYQFWTFSYASGDSIPYSAHLLRQSLRRAREIYDPHRSDRAFDRTVVVGHSLGGILAKMLVQHSGSRLWQTVCEQPVDKVAGPPDERLLLQHALCYRPAREVRRVVFITTPHRGSPLVVGRIRTLGTRICARPSPFVRAREALLSGNVPDLFAASFRGELPTSLGELTPGHPLLSAVCDLAIDPSVPFHSIIADLREPPSPGGTDGLVPYTSSHLNGAASELLLHGLHICLDDPAVIREVRRILMEHAGNESTSRKDHQSARRPESAALNSLHHKVRGTTDGLTGNLHAFSIEVQP
jgi:hypothetical protein